WWVLVLLCLVLMCSGGGWIGIAAGIGVWGVLLLFQHNMLSRKALADWWAKRRLLVRLLTVGTVVIGVIGIFIVLIIFLQSFQEAGRSADLRTDIYRTAITLFRE